LKVSGAFIIDPLALPHSRFQLAPVIGVRLCCRLIFRLPMSSLFEEKPDAMLSRAGVKLLSFVGGSADRNRDRSLADGAEYGA
jgi:hypothetical protein